MSANSVITAKAQISLLREEIYDRLSDAQRELQNLVPAASSLHDEHRLAAKANGVGFVQRFHVEPILNLEGPSLVLDYVRKAEESIHGAGYESAFLQGVDLAFGYIRGYFR